MCLTLNHPLLQELVTTLTLFLTRCFSSCALSLTCRSNPPIFSLKKLKPFFPSCIIYEDDIGRGFIASRGIFIEDRLLRNKGKNVGSGPHMTRVINYMLPSRFGLISTRWLRYKEENGGVRWLMFPSLGHHVDHNVLLLILSIWSN